MVVEGLNGLGKFGSKTRLSVVPAPGTADTPSRVMTKPWGGALKIVESWPKPQNFLSVMENGGQVVDSEVG